MAFYRVRTIKNRRYLYREERYRVGKKVKSRSTYLGAVGAFMSAALAPPTDAERISRAVERATEDAAKERAQRGLKPSSLPVPSVELQLLASQSPDDVPPKAP